MLSSPLSFLLVKNIQNPLLGHFEICNASLLTVNGIVLYAEQWSDKIKDLVMKTT